MAEANTYHNKLRSGIILSTGRTDEQGTSQPVSQGTFSGLARRDSDAAKVLVTNSHVITGDITADPNGGELVFHDRVHAHNLVGIVPVRDDENPSWAPIRPPGSTEPFVTNPADAAYCLLESNVSAKFVLHDHPNHTERKVLSGTKEPVEDEENPMELIMLGSLQGERRVTVEHVNTVDSLGNPGEDDPLRKRAFHGVTVLRIPDDQPPFELGESGSPVLYYDNQRNGYRMCCIVFGGGSGARFIVAIPASVVERELKIKFGNSPPIVLAGRDKLITAGHRVTLEGSVSDPDPADRDYVVQNHTWTQDDDNPATITLARVEGRPAQRTFTPSTTGDYTFTLTATDKEGWSVSDEVQVRVLESSQSLIPASVTATVAASSVDISWNSVSIATGYEVQVGVAEDGGEIGYASYTTDALTYRVANLAANTRYYYRVRAADNSYVGPWSAEASVVTTAPPEANAGADQVAKLGATVTLDGSGSRDRAGGTIASYSWKQVQGPSVALTGADPASPTFTAPSSPAYLRFRLTVTDNDGDSDIDAVIVRATNSTDPAALTNLPPTADAGETQTVDAGTSVTLDGSGSSDPDTGDTLTYAWTQTQGPTVTLGSADTASPTFTAPSSATTLRFRLTVKDTHQFAAIDAVVITVNAAAPTPTPPPTPPPPPPEPTPEPPTPPTNITATATANSVTVSWDAVSGATGYDMQLGVIEEGDEIGYANHPTTNLTYTVSNLKSNTRYYYRVRSKNAEGAGAWSAVASLVTPLKIWEDTGETRNEVIGDWMDTGRTQQDPVDDTWEKEQTRTVTWEKEQRCTNCAAGTPNKWVNASRTDIQWVPYTPKPTVAPSNVTATATANSVTVSWDAVSGADDYNLEIGIPAASGGLGHTSHITTGTSVTAGSLLPQTTYEYRVQARNAEGDGPWTGWATVVTEGEIPPKPTNDQWDIRHSNGKIQAKVTEIPSVTPAITQARVHMSTGQPPNQTAVTKAIGTTLNSWVDLLASGDTGWATGVTWVASIRFENSVGNSAYSLPGKSVAVPTPPPTVTHVWTWVDPAEYTGCGPTRKRRQECSNGHASHTRLVSASEPLRWGRWYNTEHERNKVVGSWTDTSSYRGCGPDRDRQQQQRITWENEQERQSHCGNIESRWVARSTTDTRWIGAPEPLEWGEWSDTGKTHYDDADGRLYKEQRRTSQCDDTQTRWVAA